MALESSREEALLDLVFGSWGEESNWGSGGGVEMCRLQNLYLTFYADDALNADNAS